MQTQVAEYKQLKDTLNRIPSLRNPERAEPRNVSYPQGTPQGYNVRESPTGVLREVRGGLGSLVGDGPCGAVQRRNALPTALSSYPADSYKFLYITSLVGNVSTQSSQLHLHFPTQLI